MQQWANIGWAGNSQIQELPLAPTSYLSHPPLPANPATVISFSQTMQKRQNCAVHLHQYIKKILEQGLTFLKKKKLNIGDICRITLSHSENRLSFQYKLQQWNKDSFQQKWTLLMENQSYLDQI